MFQFPPFAPGTAGCRGRPRRVAPFGHPRIYGHLPLPAAFRSLSRPSSPPRAKASPMRPFLTLFFLKETAAGTSRLPVLCLRAVENTSSLVYSGCSLFLVIYVVSLITRSTRFHDVNVLFLADGRGFSPRRPLLFRVVLGRVELPTSTLSV